MSGRGGRQGFTLIEVLGALIIFTLGVLMTLNLTDSMSEQLDRAAVRSELITRARTQLDSLEAESYGTLAVASTQTTVTVRGRSYRQVLAVTTFSPLVKELSVTLEPLSGSGPRETLTSYLSDRW